MGDGDCDKGSSEWLFDELTYFQPRMGEERPFYLIEPMQQKGIHCRFGMKVRVKRSCSLCCLVTCPTVVFHFSRESLPKIISIFPGELSTCSY